MSNSRGWDMVSSFRGGLKHRTVSCAKKRRWRFSGRMTLFSAQAGRLGARRLHILPMLWSCCNMKQWLWGWSYRRLRDCCIAHSSRLRDCCCWSTAANSSRAATHCLMTWRFATIRRCARPHLRSLRGNDTIHWNIIKGLYSRCAHRYVP